MRTNIAAANWKMNQDYSSGIELTKSLLSSDKKENTKVIIATPFIHLKEACELASSVNNFHIAAQNIHHLEKGAYTGEVSGSMLKSVGVEYVLIGHSERRQYQNENGDIIRQKIDQALANGLKVIYCCGEALEIRKAGNHIKHVIGQINTELVSYLKTDLDQFVIAYEPIWAIGTGETASPVQAQEMHKEIRQALNNEIGAGADAISILYGGSVKPANAQELFGQADVDGGLVGGASLKAETFGPIINAF